MIRFLADENFNNDIVRGLVRRVPGVDIVRVQDVGLKGADDSAVLAYAADVGRIILTHDLATLVGLAYIRIANGEPVAGVIAMPQLVAVGSVVEDLVIVAGASLEGDRVNQVRFVPLR